eukprot:15464058-Alexandrium_andersonii.AAC.1
MFWGRRQRFPSISRFKARICLWLGKLMDRIRPYSQLSGGATMGSPDPLVKGLRPPWVGFEAKYRTVTAGSGDP